MRVKIRRYAQPGATRSLDKTAAPLDTRVEAPQEEEVDIPATPFLTVGGIGGLVTTLITLLTFVWITKPNADQARAVTEGEHRMEVLRQAMQAGSADGRRTSLNLLLATGLLEIGDTTRVASLLRPVDGDTLPLWPASAQAPRQASTQNSPARQRPPTDSAGTGTGTGSGS